MGWEEESALINGTASSGSKKDGVAPKVSGCCETTWEIRGNRPGSPYEADSERDALAIRNLLNQRDGEPEAPWPWKAYRLRREVTEVELF
jgi:hypothetical protein